MTAPYFCPVEDCYDRATRSGFCRAHDKLLHEPQLEPARKTNAPRPCRAEGCAKTPIGRGWCTRHYQAVVRRGKDPSTLRFTDRTGTDAPDVDLTEHQFVLMKEFRVTGRKKIEFAREHDLRLGVINEAWEFRNFHEYRAREKFRANDWDGSLTDMRGTRRERAEA